MPHIGSQDPFFVSNNEDKLYFMRKPFIFLISLVVVMFTMTSCDWLTGESDQSPEIYSSYFYVNPVFEGDSIISAQDTLYAHQSTEVETVYQMDSLTLGDTVFFAPTFYTHSQDLVSIKIDWDTAYFDFTMSIPESISKHLTNQSDITKGQLFFNPGFNRVSFPCYFTAKEYGRLPLKLTVASTSQFSPTSVTINIPIKKPE
jgi:hypothetical protein